MKHWTFAELNALPIQAITAEAPARWKCEYNLQDEEGDPVENLQALEVKPVRDQPGQVCFGVCGHVEDMPGMQDIMLAFGPEQQVSLAFSLLQHNGLDIEALMESMTQPRASIYARVNDVRHRQVLLSGLQNRTDADWSMAFAGVMIRLSTDWIEGIFNNHDAASGRVALKTNVLEMVALGVGWLEAMQEQDAVHEILSSLPVVHPED